MAGTVAASQSVQCDVCGSTHAGMPRHRISDFQLVRCPDCGVLRVNPRLDDKALAHYYDEAYWASQDSVQRGYFDYTGDEANIRRTFRARMRLLPKPAAAGPRWLDVGCAAGFLVQEGLDAGWDAYGVEWSGHIIRQAVPLVRERITQGSLEQAQWGHGFDVISMWDYLEHSPHPRLDLEKAYTLLNPGGRLSVIIPDAGSWLAGIMGPRWEEFKKPQEHLYFFTGRQLRRLLRSLGMVETFSGRAGKYATLGFAFSRFQPGDGVLYWGARLVSGLLRALGLLDAVVYINPRDKLHLICRKPAVAGPSSAKGA